MEYASLIGAVKTFLKNIPFKSKLQKFCGPKVPFGPHKLVEHNACCKSIRDLLNKNDTVPTAQIKYFEEGFRIDKNIWKKHYITPFKCTTDTSLQWLQYRILHRILATNYLLTKMGIKDSEYCTFCGTHRETIVHIFFDCSVVQDFLLDVSRYLLTRGGLHITITKSKMIFGIPLNNKNKVINWVLLHCKKFIYNSRIRNKLLNVNCFWKILEQEFISQRYILLKNNKFQEFNMLWKPWSNTLLSNPPTVE